MCTRRSHPSRRTRNLHEVRVVSLLPSATEIVFALGCGDALVGVTFECDHPPEARTRRIVSTSTLPEGLTPAEIDAVVSARLGAGEDLYRLDEQALADLDADVVLTQDLCAVCAVDVERVDEALAYLGCTADVVTLDPQTLDDVIESVATVGAALEAPERAAAVVAQLRERLDALAIALDGLSRPRVLTLEWTAPAFSAGHWVPELVAAGGGSSVLARPGRDSTRIAWDEVLTAPAEVVLVAPCGFHLDGAWRLASELVDAGRLPQGAEVWAVDADSYFVRPGPRVVDGAELVARILHPDQVGVPGGDDARQVASGRSVTLSRRR
jgi:iron complex transport system substrate-binding protein